MKKFLVIAIVLALIFCLTIDVFAAVTIERTRRTIRRDATVNMRVDTHETRRVVSGRAEYQLGPNFLDNDWDDVYAGSWSNLTQADLDFLRSLTGLSNAVWYYIDMTTHTVSTAPFQDYTELTSSQTIDEYFYDDLDPYTTLITHIQTTILTFNNVSYQLILQVWDASPIVLDLNRDNKIDTAKNEWQPHAPKFYVQFAKFFDITGDGGADFTEWMTAKPADGLLVMPENGKVETALHLFGTAGGYADGYEKLSIICDKDKNGWVEGEELEGLAIWIDENNDAKCQPDELKKLSDYNIKKISANHKDYVSVYKTGDGKTYTTWDWWPAWVETRKFRR